MNEARNGGDPVTLMKLNDEKRTSSSPLPFFVNHATPKNTAACHRWYILTLRVQKAHFSCTHYFYHAVTFKSWNLFWLMLSPWSILAGNMFLYLVQRNTQTLFTHMFFFALRVNSSSVVRLYFSRDQFTFSRGLSDLLDSFISSTLST